MRWIAASIPGWASFNPGTNETDGVLAYIVSNVSDPGLFSAPIEVANNGTLSYTAAANEFGTVTFDVTVRDDGTILVTVGADKFILPATVKSTTPPAGVVPHAA